VPASPGDASPRPDLKSSPLTRRAVNLFLGVGMLASLTGFLGTILAYLWPLRSGAATSDLLRGTDGEALLPDALLANEGVVARNDLGKILVLRRPNGEFIGMQATCTHLGCTVAWNSKVEQVECPCHGARYNLLGEVLRGPARDPLSRVEIVVDEAGLRAKPIS
jgi:nitrite reductase/ring-hydroxylating ferredoxin subunit